MGVGDGTLLQCFGTLTIIMYIKPKVVVVRCQIISPHPVTVHYYSLQSNLCYPGTSLNQAADLPYFMLTLQKL